MIKEPGKKRRKTFRWIAAITLIALVGLCVTGVFVLKRGITLDHLEVGAASLTGATIVWDDKLDIHLESIEVISERTRQKTSEPLANLTKFIEKIGFLSLLVSEVRIESAQVADWKFSFQLHQEHDQLYRIVVENERAKLEALLKNDPDRLAITIENLRDTDTGITVAGLANLSKKNNTITGSLNADVRESFPIALDFSVDGEKVTFHGKENGVITDIEPLVDLFALPHSITRWFVDYLVASRYHLVSVKGTYVFGDPLSIFNSLEAEVVVDDVAYTFEPDLEPIYDDHPRATFKNGVLDIRPSNPVFYGHDGGESWLDINFNDFNNMLLTAHIIAQSQADQKILDLLSYYSIDLPFLQVEGETEANLQLTINFQAEDVSGSGTFFIEEGTILYDGVKFDVKDSRFSLKGADVNLEQINVRMGDMFVAHVAGEVFAGRDVWNLDIDFEKLTFDLGESTLNLDKHAAAPKIGYHVSPEGHFLDVSKSHWLLDSTHLELGPFRTPVDLERLAAEVPKVLLEIKPGIKSEVTGTFSIKDKFADFSCELQQYNVNNLRLEQPSMVFRVKYLDRLFINSQETSQWSLSNAPLTIYPSEMDYADNIITTASSSFSYGDFFSSKFTGYFNTATREGTLYLSMLELIDERMASKVDVGDRTVVDISEEDGVFLVDFQEFGLQISTDKDRNWSAEFKDLSKMYERSELFRTFKVQSGVMKISSENGKPPYHFQADIISPYSLLREQEATKDRLIITGSLKEDGLSAIINSDIHIDYQNDELEIKTWNIGFSFNGLRQLLKDIIKEPTESENEEESSFSVHFDGINSYIYLNPKSRILADRLQLRYLGGEIGLELEHQDGIIQLERVGDVYFFNGDALGDTFIQALLNGSYMQGGTVAFAGMGSEDELSAVLEIQDTVFKDLKSLNNTITLLNTLPALVTFSVPEYEVEGLPVDTALAGLRFGNDRIVFKSIVIDSPVLQAKGKGLIDTSSREIDMDIVITSQGKQDLRKIPLVGYVVAGDDTENSIALKISGSIDDPQVENTALEEIVTIPMDILFRTLNLPAHLVNKLQSFSEKMNSSVDIEKRASLPENQK